MKSIYNSGTVYTDSDIEKIKERLSNTTVHPVSDEERYAVVTDMRGDETLQELAEKYYLPTPFVPWSNVFAVWQKANLLFDEKTKNSVTEAEVWKMIALSAIYNWKSAEETIEKYEDKYINTEGDNNMDTNKPDIQEFECPVCKKTGGLTNKTADGKKIVECSKCGKKFSELGLDIENKKIILFNTINLD